MKELLPLIMLSYNTVGYIAYFNKSVLNQINKNVVFIVYDDCSTDNSKEIIPSIKYKRSLVNDRLNK